ncbi:hypothetical protein H8E06_00485 [bacterium]|nr:hypothetical protein [bacterium]
MTSQEKHIYNSYLRISRSRQNKPFKLRKDFSKFEDDKNYKYVIKLNNILNRNKSIQLEDFLNAPYEIYGGDEHFDLKFYTTQRAINLYVTYTKRRMADDIDNDKVIEKIKESLYFIYTFCKDNDITLKEYIEHKTNAMNSFILHVHENKIILYTLFGFNTFEKELNKTSYEVREFILGDLVRNIDRYRKNFQASNKAKGVIRKGLSEIYKLQNKVEK